MFGPKACTVAVAAEGRACPSLLHLHSCVPVWLCVCARVFVSVCVHAHVCKERGKGRDSGSVSTTGANRLKPVSQIQSAASICMARKLRMIFTFLNG